MAVIWRTRRLEPLGDEPAYTRDFHPEVETCSFCDKPTATAYWRMGDSLLSVCRLCALEVLAKLVADALTGDRPAVAGEEFQVQKDLMEFEWHFWRAAALQARQQAVLGAKASEEQIPV